MADERTELEPEREVSQESEPGQQSSASKTDANGPEPAFGWTSYAELINGRFAMIGFVALLIIELITHKSFFQWLWG
jgi:hypothetical protein